MTAFYLSIYLLTAVVLSLLAMKIPTTDKHCKAAYPLLALALTPHFITLSAALSAFLFPGQLSVLRLSPLILSIALAAIIRFLPTSSRTPLPSLAHASAGLRLLLQGMRQQETRTILPWAVAALATVWVVCKFVSILASNTFPVIAHDALVYLSEAKYFINELHLSAFRHGNGAAQNGLPPTHPHTFTFSLYLAHALSFALPDSKPPYGDLAARAAFQLTVFSLWLSVIAASLLTAIQTRNWRPGKTFAVIALVAGLSFFMFPAFEYMSFASSRDPYRLVPWVMLVAMLARLITARQWKWPLLAATGAAASMTIAAHALNAYFIILAALVFMPFALARRTRLGEWLHLLSWGMLLGILPASHYLLAWARHGSPLGNGINYFHYRGTPLMEAFRAHQSWGQNKLGFLASLDQVMSQHDAIFGRLIPILAMVFILTLIWKKEFIKYRQQAFITLVFLASLMIPITDFLRFLPIDMKEAYLSNFRYVYTAYILSPLVVSYITTIIFMKIHKSNPIITNIATPAALSILSLVATYNLNKWRYYSSYTTPLSYIRQMQELCPTTNNLKKGKIWLSDRATLGYYCNSIPSFLYSPYGRKFFTPTDEKEIISILKSEKVSTVILEDHWWPRTAFYKALSNQAKSGKATLTKTKYLERFSLKYNEKR